MAYRVVCKPCALDQEWNTRSKAYLECAMHNQEKHATRQVAKVISD